MGKVKKVISQGDNQSKISSFFQAGASKPVSSDLFTQLGNSNKSATSGKLSLKKTQKTKHEFTETKTKEPIKHSDGKDGMVKTVDLTNDNDFKSSKQAFEKSSSTTEKFKEPVVIPETQNLFSPVTPKSRGDNSVSGSPGNEILIPDTPDDTTAEFGKKRKNYSRSFLTACTKFGQRIGQKVTPDGLKKKKILHAKKSLISVSVNFNKQSEKFSTEYSNENSKVIVVGDNENTASVQFCQELLDNNTSTASGSVHNDNETKVTNNSSDTSQTEAETPTKTNGLDHQNVKRMSKPGLSPAAKRCNNMPDMKNINENGELTYQSPESAQDKDKVKRVLSLGELGNGQVKKAKDMTKIYNYQLSMNRSDKNKYYSDKKHLNLENDGILGEILNELHENSTPQASVLLKKKKSRNSLSSTKKVENSVSPKEKSFDQSLTEEEMKYFDELDDKLHVGCVKDLHIESEIKCDQNRKNHHTVSENSKNTTVSDNLRRSHSKTSVPVIVEEDLKATQLERELPSSLTSSDISRQDLASLMDESDLIRPEIEEFHTQNCGDIVGPSSGKIIPTQNIGEFSSQKSLVSSATDNGHVEMDIEEFSQLDSEELCSEFKSLSPFKKRQEESMFQSKPHCWQYGRYTVISIEFSQGHQDMILTLKDCIEDSQKICQLSGFWADTHVQEGDIVHIIAEIDDKGRYRITDSDGLIIINPDLLLSGTTVVSSVFCMRKSILNEKFKGCDSKNVQMLYGSIIHCIFQQVLQKKLIEENKILSEAEEVVKQNKYLHEIYGNNTTECAVMEEIKKYIPPLQKWLEKYTKITQTVLSASKSSTGDITITKVKDIEENIWSPRFGIKGKIDLTVDVQIKNKGSKVNKTTVPLELKTGRPTFSMEHKGQVSLYSMMSSDRREDPQQGLLLYLKEPDMKLIPVNHLNKRGLIQLRNEMAYYLSQKMNKLDTEGHVTYSFGKLPEPINNQRACVKCPQLLNCSLYQQNIEHRSVHSGHAMSTLVPNSLSHLSITHMEYYTHWVLMLDLEMQTDLKTGKLKDIWCKTGIEREDIGDCISGLVMTSDNTANNSTSDNGLCVVQFTRHPQHPRLSSPLNLIGLSVDDYIIVSTENSNHIGLCTGSVRHISEHRVELITERESIPRLLELKSAIFRLDKCNSYNTASIFYSNLSRLMTDEAHCTRLRELLIDKRKPEFVVKLSKSEIEKVKTIFKPLNKPQKTAILKVLMSTDYVLIKGYPGTGKTSTIVALVKVLQILGYSVLLTSYTHSAVDNILLKLKKDKINFLRLGKISKIHPGIQDHAAENLTRKFSSVSDLREFYSEQKIVATSSLGTNHPLFTQRKFDVCIIDEASQVLQPACLGPLYSAHKFVLVGDPKQLPPVVQSKEARSLGMDESLFSRLDDSGATYELNLQYRMNSEIMSLSNTLVYNGALQCGSEKVANGQLHLSDDSELVKIYDRCQWIQDIFIKEPYKAAVLLDTEQVPAPEIRDPSGLIKNIVEAKIVHHLVDVLIKGGIQGEDVGVIAPYRNQVKVIREQLHKDFAGVEVNTVDQYQGRDKRVIIISFTRCIAGNSAVESKSGELLKDIRRLNVAVTRAKEKLIMIGHRRTLQLYEPMSDILSLLEQKNTIINLPVSADF